MKALQRTFAVFAFLAALAPGCDSGSTGDSIIDDILGPPQGGQQVDPLLEATAGATAVALGDFNDDNRMDFVSISSENQPVQLHLLNGQSAFDLLSIAGGGPLAIMSDVAAVDLNNDNRLDIAVLVNDTGYVPPEGAAKPAALILLIQGDDVLNPSDWTQVQPDWACYDDPTLAQCGLFYAANQTGPTDLEVGDFDGDGLPDLAVTANNFSEDPLEPNTFVYVYLNPGIASVTNPDAWQAIPADADVNNYTSLSVVDLDNDGDDDLVASAPAAKTHNIRWLRNRGDGVNWDEIMVGQQVGGGNYIDVGDINGDDAPDVVAAASGHSLVQWFRNPGPSALAPTATQVPWYVYNVGLIEGAAEAGQQGEGGTSAFNQLQVLDTDGDGQLEVYATGNGLAYEFQRAANVFEPWTGTAVFAANPTGTLGTCAFYDYSGNGRLDIIVPVDRPGLLEDGIFLFAR